MKLCELIFKDEYISASLNMEEAVDKVTVKPEECDENTLLIIPGENKNPSLLFNLHARALVCGIDVEVLCNIPIIRVKNSRRCAAYIFSRFSKIDYSRLKIIGITGTNGKSSTAEFTKCALEGCGIKVGVIGTGRILIGGEAKSEDYYSMTTPDPWILYPALKEMEKCGCEAVVMEISSHALALEKVAPIPFDIAVFTNLSKEHLDFHKTTENYYSAKKKLFYQAKLKIINIDDCYGRRLARELQSDKITVGVLWRGEVYSSNIEKHGFDGIRYMYHGKNFTFKLNLHTAGVFNIYNSMLAITAATALGAPPYKVKKALSELVMIKGRYEIIKDEITVIIDYAHTDTALENILRSIREVKRHDQNLTVVFGCGGERDTEKRPRMAKIAETYADQIVVTNDNSRGERTEDIIFDIVSGFEKKRHTVIADRRAAIEYAIKRTERKGIVAIIGKGAELYNIDKDGYHPFDERTIIKEALIERARLRNEN